MKCYKVRNCHCLVKARHTASYLLYNEPLTARYQAQLRILDYFMHYSRLTMANTLQRSGSTPSTNPHLLKRGYWATIMDNSITPAEPISAVISLVKEPESSTSTPRAFAAAQLPQLARSGNQKMPRVETTMPHAEMDYSNSGPEDNADERNIKWTVSHPRNPVASSSKRVRRLWTNAQRHKSPFRGEYQREGALDLRYIVKPATWLGMQNYVEYTGELTWRG